LLETQTVDFIGYLSKKKVDQLKFTKEPTAHVAGVGTFG